MFRSFCSNLAPTRGLVAALEIRGKDLAPLAINLNEQLLWFGYIDAPMPNDEKESIIFEFRFKNLRTVNFLAVPVWYNPFSLKPPDQDPLLQVEWRTHLVPGAPSSGLTRETGVQVEVEVSNLRHGYPGYFELWALWTSWKVVNSIYATTSLKVLGA